MHVSYALLSGRRSCAKQKRGYIHPIKMPVWGAEVKPRLFRYPVAPHAPLGSCAPATLANVGSKSIEPTKASDTPGAMVPGHTAKPIMLNKEEATGGYKACD